MASREIDLIMRLREAKSNSAQVKQIQKRLEGFQKTLKEAYAQSDNLGKSSQKILPYWKRLNKEMDRIVASLKKAGSGDSGLSKVAENASNSIEKMVESISRGKKAYGGLAREGISKMEALAATTERMASKNYDLMDSLQSMYPAFVAKEFDLLSKSEEKTIAVTDTLTKKLRDLQAVSSIKGTSMFTVNIKSARIFSQELEKLRLNLAKVSGEKAFSSAFGISNEMISRFQKAQKQVANLGEKVASLREKLGTLKQGRASLEALADGFQIMSNKTNKAIKSINFNYLIDGTHRIEGENAESAQKIVDDWAKARSSIARELQALGVSFDKNSANVKEYEKIVEIALDKLSANAKKSGIFTEIAAMQKENIDQMIQMVLQYTKSLDLWSSKEEKMAAKGQVYGKIQARVAKLREEYNKLLVTQNELPAGIDRVAVSEKTLNAVLKESSSLMRMFTGESKEAIQAIYNYALSVRKAALSEDQMIISSQRVMSSLRNIDKEYKIVNEAMKHFGTSQTLLRKKSELASQKTKELADSVLYLSRMLNATKDPKAIEKINRQLVLFGSLGKKARAEAAEINKQLSRMDRLGADASRALDRLSSTGFANMIISQAAWMAGFQVIFGTLEKFKAALASVVDEQEAVTRAMRTARSDIMSASEIWDAYTKAISDARMKTGTEISELGEIMYQLGSAGLSAEESIAALDSTLANIIGTEAEARDITKLVAGVYNNFSEQIVKIDGRVKTISNTWDGYSNHVVTAATETEKFKKINDLLVGAFRDNQVEMNELKDGLKFMAQSAKIANISLSDSVGILAFLNNHLIKAGTAGRAMRVILSRITKDAKGFADAFDIDIDLTKPLDFMNIIDQIHNKLKGQEKTVDDIGKIFDRLGLRGAEAFAALITQTERLHETMEDVKTTTEDAANEMMNIRLDNIAKQAGIAVAKIEGLLKNGLRPLIETAELVIVAFNKIVSVLTFLDNAFGGVLSTILKWAGITAMLTAIYYGFKNIGMVVRWFKAVLITLVASMKNFGDSVLKTDGEVKKHEISIRRATSALREYRVAVFSAAKANYQITSSVAGVSKKMAVVNATWSTSVNIARSLRTAILALSSAVKAIGMMFVWMIAIDIITYFANYDEVLKKAVKEQKKLVESTKKNIDGLQALSDKLTAASKGTGDYDNIARRVAEALGIYIPRNEKLTKTYEELNKELKEHMEIQKRLLRIRMGELIAKELDDLGAALENLSAEHAYQSLREMQMVFSTSAADADILGKRISNLDKHIKILSDKYRMLASAMEQYEKAGGVVDSGDKKRLENLKYTIEGTKEYQRQLIALQHQKQVEAGLISDSINQQQKEAEARERNRREQEKAANTHIAEMNSLRSLNSSIETQINSIKKLGRETESYYLLLKKMKADSLVGGYEEMGNAIDKIVEKKKEEVKITEKSIASILKELNSVKNLTEYQKQRLQVLNDAFGNQKKLNEEQIRALELIRDQIKANNDLITSLNRLKNEMPELEKGFADLQDEMNMYKDLMKKIEQYTSGAGVSLDELGRYFESTAERMKRLSDSKAIEDFNDKMDSMKSKLDEIRNAGSPIDVKEWLGDLKEVGTKGNKILAALYARIREIEKEIRQAKEWNISIKLKIDAIIDREAEDYLSRLKRKFEDLAKTSNKWSYDLTRAYQKYRSELDKAIKKDEKRMEKAEKAAQAAQKAADAAIKVAKNEELAANKRYEAAKKAKEQLDKEIKAQNEALKAARERYEKELALIDAKEKAGRISHEDAERQRRQAERDYDNYSQRILKILEGLKAKADEVAGLMEKLGEKAMIPLGQQMKAILKQMDELQRMAKEGIQLEYSKITEAKKEAMATNAELIKKIEKIITTDPTMDTLLQKASDLNDELRKPIHKHIYYHEHDKPEGDKKFWGGVIKRAQGGIVPAMVTKGEGYIPPQMAREHRNLLNILNSGRVVNSVPSSMATFNGPSGIDNIPAYLPEGSFVMSKRGMEAYERSVKKGAKTFQEGGEVSEFTPEESGSLGTQEFGTLTIVVEKEGGSKDFQVSGKPSVLKELREELEEERLTRLH